MASEELQEELEALTCAELISKLFNLFESEQEDDVDECLDWFLFTYSPEHAFQLVQSKADAFRDGMFLNITMTKVRDIYEPEIFLESLNIVSCLEGYEQDIAKTGAVRATIMMMGRDIHNPRSQVLGCKVLANLAHDLEVCKWVGKVKGIPRLIETLKRHMETPDVSIEVCRTLANLAFRCKQNKEIMVTEKCIEAILAAIGVDKTNEKLVNAGLRAIRNIVSECEDFSMGETLLLQVMDAMTDFAQGLDVQINGIWILVNLMSGKVNVKRRIVEQGAIEHILSGMETHFIDPHVQLAGATALALLSKVAAYRQIIARKGGIPLLISALRNHRQIVPIQRAVIKAVFRLSFNEPNRNKLGELKIVSEIMESMKVNLQSGPLQRIAILCLVQLSKNKKLREIIQSKAVPLIIQARNKFNDVLHIHRVASAAVEKMVSSSNTNTAAVPKNGISKEAESLQIEIKNLLDKLSEKDSVLHQLQLSVEQLETQVHHLKAGVHLDTLNEVMQKIGSKKEISKLKQQKLAVTKELKRVQTETEEVSTTLESVINQLKEEDKKGKDHRRSFSSEVKMDKKPKDSTVPNDKRDSLVYSGKKNAKHGSAKKANKDKGNTSPTKTTTTKRNGSQKASKTTKGRKLSISDPTKGNSEAGQHGDGSMGLEHKDHVSMRPVLTGRSSLRNINRKLSISINPAISSDEILQLNKQIEEIQIKFEEKEQELATTNEEKNKVIAQVNKLNMDLTGTHILIQTLQKESLSQTHNREKLVTGNSFFTRHQKKLKSIKDEIGLREKENEELKKEIAALGGEILPSSPSQPPNDKIVLTGTKKKKKH